MEDISVEKKMELVHQVRSQYQKNQYDLMNRESLLYGKTYTANTGYTPPPSDSHKDSTLKIRYALAVLLLLSIIILDRSGKSFAGISMKQVFQAIEADFEDTLEFWASEIKQ